MGNRSTGPIPPTTAPPGWCDTSIPCSPILIDLDRGGFRLTSAGAGTDFDFDRDGIPEKTAWTERGGGDAWLAVDRNGNGQIDDGSELFGNFTDQPESADPNGYRALALYDDDRNLKITAADSVFPNLRLWLDSNGDGLSQQPELIGLAAAGVEWIDLQYVVSRSRDRHGNEFRYRGRVGLSTGVTQSADVFLTVAPPEP